MGHSNDALQMPLGGFESPKPTDRLFFAVLPDAETALRIASLTDGLRSEIGLAGKPESAHRLHVTLYFLGDHAGLPPGLTANARQAGALADAAPFQATFDRAASFRGSRVHPFVLQGGDGVAALHRLHGLLGRAMASVGLERYTRGTFTPHITLLRDTRLVPARPIAPVAWTVNEVVLVHSLIGRTEHRILDRWPLREVGLG